MDKKTTAGHIMALITIVIWGTTFISTKILLADFTPIEILFFRFLLGLFVLIAIYPRRLRIKDKKQELTFAAAGLCGVCLYYLLENIALIYTMASNVGVIISVAPFFTAILSHIFLRTEEKLKAQFFVCFVVAMTGICLISFNGEELELNPIGDILAIAAAFVWAIYSLLTRKISGYGYNTIQTTRRIFTYGIVFMLPFLFVFNFSLDVQKVIKPEYALNLIYLGLGASALCFVTWNYAVKVLGAVKTSEYIYIVPVITIVTSVIVLKEEITWTAALGIGLTLIGLFVSESKLKLKNRGK
ncbi:MAG: DMT family transporter [Dorea sp.]|nr:DMT family transporter [Dorea sp.]